MEFTILDGRRSFYQWDLNQKLQVNDPAVEQVHFAAEEGNALVCEVYEKDGKFLADVPNILLQRAGDLVLFAVSKGRTLYARRFGINEREKPGDYIYTETEVRSVEKIVEEMLATAASQVDLSDYVKKSDYATSSHYGIVKIGGGGGIYNADGTIYTHLASNSEINAKASSYKVIVPKNLDYAVKVAISENKEKLSDTQKLAACGWLGTAVIAANGDGTLSVKLADGSTYKLQAEAV